jgi:hypothetical protein
MGRIFDNTKYLDDGSFVAFTKALCRMSSEASGAPLAVIDTTPGSKNSKAVSSLLVLWICISMFILLIILPLPYRNYSITNPLLSKNFDL